MMICPKCGKEFGAGNFCANCGASKENNAANAVPGANTVVNPNNMKLCGSCGKPMAKNAKTCPNCGAKNKKPIYKRVWFWLLIIVAFFIIVGAISSDGDSDNKASNDSQTTKSDGVIESKKEKDNEIGQYSVEILNARLTSTYDNKPAVVVTYRFTNNTNDTATSFYIAFDDEVYQNGVGLNSAYVLKDGDPYDSDNASKEIKKGSSIEVEQAYILNDSSTPIEVEVKELFSFSDKTVSRTFNF